MSRPQNVFAPVVAAVLLVGMGAAMALRAVDSADSFRPGLNQRQPVLAGSTPALGPRPARVARRVVLVIIDGLRLRGSYGDPFLDSMRRRGVDAVARSHFPTYSRPNHVAILTGVSPAWSGVRNNAYAWPVALDSLMDRANAADLRSAYAGDLAFGVGMMFHDDFAAVHYAPWPGGFAKAARLVMSQDYPLVVLLPGGVDAAGHARGADDHAYGDATRQIDRELASVTADLDLARDTIIITADHGHTGRGGHGGTEPDVLEVPLIMAGAGIRPGAALAEVELVDVAPTAAALLGLPAPRHGLGRTLVEATTLTPMQRAALLRADSRRLQRNRAELDRLHREQRPLMEQRRVWRTAAVLAVSFIGLILVVVAHRLGVLHIDWRVLAIAVPAFPLTYYALLDLLGQRVSLSALPDRADALDMLFHFGLVFDRGAGGGRLDRPPGARRPARPAGRGQRPDPVRHDGGLAAGRPDVGAVRPAHVPRAPRVAGHGARPGRLHRRGVPCSGRGGHARTRDRRLLRPRRGSARTASPPRASRRTRATAARKPRRTGLACRA